MMKGLRSLRFRALALGAVFLSTLGAFAQPKETIVVIHGSVGKGHTTAAEVAADLARKRNPNAEVILIDLLDFVPEKERELMLRIYDALTQGRPDLYDDSFFDWLDQGRHVASIGDLPLTSNYRPQKVLEKLKSLKPDMVLTTFPSAAQVMAKLRGQGHFTDIPVGWVHTDLVDETGFARFALELDMAFVGAPEIRDSWIRRGVPADRVTASGMPISDTVRHQQPEEAIEAIRQKYGIKKNVRTVLISSGSNGVGDYPLMVKQLAAQFPNEELQIISVSGRHPTHFSNLAALKLPDNVNLVNVKGLIPPADLLGMMQMADGVIGKTGGLTPMELFIRSTASKDGKALVLLDVNGGQERPNADYFRAKGLAVITKDEGAVGKEMASLLSDAERLNHMVEAQREFVKNIKPDLVADWMTSKPSAKPRLNVELSHVGDYPAPQGLVWDCLRVMRWSLR